MPYLNAEITILLEKKFIKLENEHDTIEVIQRLRRNQFDMENLDFDLNNFRVWLI
jgi:hypothetical protein